MDGLGIDRAHVVGSSMGGAITQELALAAPERVTSIVLAGTWARPDVHLTQLLRQLSRLLLLIDDPDELLEAMCLWVYSGRAHADGTVARLIEFMGRSMSPPQSAEVFALTAEAAIAHDAADRLPTITAPTLVVVGSEDRICPMRHKSRTASTNPASLCRAFPGRFLPGLVHGMPEWLEQVGAHPGKLLPCLAETTVVTARLLAGKTVSFAGEWVNVEAVYLTYPPEEVPPISLGVRGPRGIALAGEAAGGVILAEGSGPAYIRRAVEQIGRPSHQIIVFVWFAIDDDGDVGRGRWREKVGIALGQSAMQAQLGELASEGPSDRVLRELTVSGTEMIDTVNPVLGDDAPTPAATAPFALAQVPDRLWSWRRDPVTWDAGGPGVIWRCPGETDFWRTTEGVPNAHDGCALLTAVEGDFELTLDVVGAFAERYDQAGLMVVASEVLWLKAGIEVDGDAWLSAVHTREDSDWSRERWHAPHVRLRAVRRDNTIEIFVEEAGSWRIYRTLYLPGPVGIGPYSCSPKSDGFQPVARDLTVRG